MQVKTFTGANNQEVIGRIKVELGPEAVILDSSTFHEDGRKMVRMTAALDRIDNFLETPVEQLTPGRDAQWRREWELIQRHMLALLKPALRLDRLDERQRSALEFLEREGANDQALLELYRRLLDRPGVSVLEPLGGMIPLKPWGLEHWPQKLHLVSGPFGAGKTTTTVRLALSLQKTHPGTRICIVNADAERGGGRMLLKHYAGLSDLVYREARSASEMAGILAEIQPQGFEKVIVDLPGLGRNLNLAQVTRDLALDQARSITCAAHLVFSPHYAAEAQSEFLERYRVHLPTSLIWSKLDECGRYGTILNTAVASGLSISCFSFGSGLLNTLLPAEQTALWKLLFGHELPAVPHSAIVSTARSTQVES
ncbi:MAG: flagellar biosynthesis protein FlhF [Deltaproteobacteria bacterium]|jgi:flagellar biosynthesis protein FlhF|nr:flagellar biosynthesis protein FlhF [Deltaproteobacteria bacterium]